MYFIRDSRSGLVRWGWWGGGSGGGEGENRTVAEKGVGTGQKESVDGCGDGPKRVCGRVWGRAKKRVWTDKIGDILRAKRPKNKPQTDQKRG